MSLINDNPKDSEPSLEDFSDDEIIVEVRRRDLEEEIIDNASSSTILDSFPLEELTDYIDETYPGMYFDGDFLKHELEYITMNMDNQAAVRQSIERLTWAYLGRIV